VCVHLRASAGACNERVRVHVFVCVCVCVCECSECVGVRARSCVPTRMRPSTRAFISAHVRVSVHLHRIASPRLCSTCVCVANACAMCPRCARTLVPRRRLAVFHIMVIIIIIGVVIFIVIIMINIVRIKISISIISILLL
jgi:hypothetical protein